MALKGLIGGKSTYTDPLNDAVLASQDALGIFLKAGEDLDAANDTLKGVVATSKAAIAAEQARVDQAEAQITSNTNAKGKIDALFAD